MTIAIVEDRFSSGALGPDYRPLAALSLSADDLPDLPWESDEASQTRFVCLEIGSERLALESEDGAPQRQMTVYGRTASALDELLKELGVSESDVFDRIDRPKEPRADDGADIRRELEEVQRRAADIEAQLHDAADRAARLEEERKQAAAILFAASGEELTERQRQTLSLVLSGMTPDEIASVLDISRETVLRHKRRALAHEAAKRVAPPDSDVLTAREREVASLAVAGLSIREISEQLFVTAMTVRRHLSSVYQKLGVTSRDELRKTLHLPT